MSLANLKKKLEETNLIFQDGYKASHWLIARTLRPLILLEKLAGPCKNQFRTGVFRGRDCTKFQGFIVLFSHRLLQCTNNHKHTRKDRYRLKYWKRQSDPCHVDQIIKKLTSVTKPSIFTGKWDRMVNYSWDRGFTWCSSSQSHHYPWKFAKSLVFQFKFDVEVYRTGNLRSGTGSDLCRTLF